MPLRNHRFIKLLFIFQWATFYFYQYFCFLGRNIIFCRTKKRRFISRNLHHQINDHIHRGSGNLVSVINSCHSSSCVSSSGSAESIFKCESLVPCWLKMFFFVAIHKVFPKRHRCAYWEAFDGGSSHEETIISKALPGVLIYMYGLCSSDKPLKLPVFSFNLTFK